MIPDEKDLRIAILEVRVAEFEKLVLELTERLNRKSQNSSRRHQVTKRRSAVTPLYPTAASPAPDVPLFQEFDVRLLDKLTRLDAQASCPLLGLLHPVLGGLVVILTRLSRVYTVGSVQGR